MPYQLLTLLLLPYLCFAANPPEVDNRIIGPEEALKFMKVADGFELELVAAEPLVVNPIIMRFDAEGKLWVVELVNYMKDLKGTGERDPGGRISVLLDTDNDGKMDKKTIVLDDLREPRALNFYKNGILWADCQKLYFTEIYKGYKAGKTTVIDEKYAVMGNVEHKANELIRGLDGWFYSAKYDSRYREQNGRWLKEKTEFRGQWGMSMDQEGRFYHNQQMVFLRGDIFTPNFFMRNPQISLNIAELSFKTNQVEPNCFNIRLIDDHVKTIRTSRDIRDGEGTHATATIDANFMARRSTAACGPFYYLGDHFPDSFKDTVFIADPGLHIVKAVKVDRSGLFPQGKNHYRDQEILASTDTRFRPVNFELGPDGSLYVADLYHGILQHKVYMNKYLAGFVRKNKLDEPDKLGRIYRLKVKGKKLRTAQSLNNLSAETLVSYLSHNNGWQRATARRLLVDRQLKEAIPSLKKLVVGKHISGAILALTLLEEFQALDEDILLQAMKQEPAVIRQAIRSSWHFGSEAINNHLIHLVEKEFTETTYYALQRLAGFDNDKTYTALSNAFVKWSSQPFILETIISGLSKPSKWFTALPTNIQAQAKDCYEKALKRAQHKAVAPTHLHGETLLVYLKGQKIYNELCAACHKDDGQGISNLGPPLAQSEWVTGDKTRLGKIILYGLKGPVHVRGKKYTPPVAMPGLFENKEYDNRKIAAIMTYIRNSWGNKSQRIWPGFVETVRKKAKNRKEPYTEKELLGKGKTP